MQCGRRPTGRIYSFIGMIRRIIMKKFTAVFAAAVLMLSLSACGKTTEVPDVPQPDIDLSAIQEAAENFPEVEIPVDPEPETESEPEADEGANNQDKIEDYTVFDDRNDPDGQKPKKRKNCLTRLILFS